jgi:hypothetical protein
MGQPTQKYCVKDPWWSDMHKNIMNPWWDDSHKKNILLMKNSF